MPTPDTSPTSVVLHFLPSVYQKTGASEMLLKLLQIFQPDSLRCVQFLCSGKIRVTFREKAVRDHHLSEAVRFEDQDIPVTRDPDKVTVLYLRDLPYEVSGEDVFDFFSIYGEVLAVERSVAAEFPDLCNGNCIVKMVLP